VVLPRASVVLFGWLHFAGTVQVASKLAEVAMLARPSLATEVTWPAE
jgi:hypothetical protein